METPVRPVREAASPSGGGEFLLQLLQQRRPSSTVPSSCSRADHNSFGDGIPFRDGHPSDVSSAAEFGKSSSFSRASSSEACAFEEEQERTRFLSRSSSTEASAPDEEQARFQLHHDPAVAAMGPSHPVGEVRAIANNLGGMSGDARGVLPFYDPRQPHQDHHHHRGVQKVPPPSRFDVSFPQPPPSEHLLSFPLDPLLPSMHNQFLRPYSYPRPPCSDPNMCLRVPPLNYSPTGLLISGRVQDQAVALRYPALDQLKSFCNDGLTNGQNMASLRLLVNSSGPSMSLPLSEDVLPAPSSQFYTQFGSIPVEMPQAPAGLDRTHQGPEFSVSKPSDCSNGDRQEKPLIIEASISNPGTDACQIRILERTGSKVSSEMYIDGVEKKLNRHSSFVNDVVTATTSSEQKLRCTTGNGSASNGISNVSDVEVMLDHGCGARSSKPQKSLDATHKGRTGLNLWVPVTKDKIEDPDCNAMGSAAVSEDATSKAIDEVTRHKNSHQEWRLKQPNLPPGQHSVRTQPSRNKLSLQQAPLGLPSGSRVESAPSSATEQSKKALQVSPGVDAVDLRMAEQVTASLKPSVDLCLERATDNAETLARSLSGLECGTENEAEEKASKITHSTTQASNVSSKEADGNARPMARSSRRQPFHGLDTRKCTSNLLTIFQTLIPPDEEEQRRRHLLASLDELVMGIWRDARLYLFGSCANGFGVCNSDIDVCLSIEGESATRSEVVCILAEALKDNHMLNVQALTHARVPIVKYSDPNTGISCDVCVNNMLAVVNTKLLHDYAQIDVRLRQLAFMVKHWAKCRQVNETYRGTLSSYAYVLMCIHFLQQRKPPVLPCLQEMEPTYRVTVGDIKCAYYDLVDNLKTFGQKNKESLADLVASFFDYWAFRHDYARTVVSIRTGNFLTKVEKEWTRRIGNERHLICIEDPFEVSHDLGRVVDKHSIRVLRDEFQRAARIMRQDANPCVTLFEHISIGRLRLHSQKKDLLSI